jgi:hypothetical protein
MDVRLSAEQRALRDSVAQVVGHLGPATVGALDDAERTAKLDAAVAAAGWRELRSADDTGSPWASGVEVAVIAEQLGRGLADAAFVGPTLAAELRRLAGTLAATVPETVLLTADLAAVVVADGGTVTPGAVAVDAAGATSAVVLIPVDGGWSLGSVPLEGATVHTDLTRPAAAPAAGVTPLPGQVRTLDDDDLARILALGLATTCADLVGAMQGTTDLATEYAKERRQYGAPIGSFQAVQHLLADALVATEGARSIGLHAAWAVDALDPHDAVAAGAMAKAYAARAARTACEASIQVHGGIGNTWECLAHLFLRRVLLSTELFGGVDANLSRVLDHQLGADRGLR